jgi:hypothetical protein
LIDVFPGLISPDETDGLDVRVIADGINCGNASVDNVKDTGRQTYGNNN